MHVTHTIDLFTVVLNDCFFIPQASPPFPSFFSAHIFAVADAKLLFQLL